jgi:uncharacterized protein (TIGR04255 family)
LDASTSPPIEDLISFADPPVSEVVLSVQFPRPAVDEVAILGRFRTAIEAEFPEVEKQAPILPAREDYSSSPQPPVVEFQMVQGAPPQRYWFISADGNELIQVQPDRFLLNWRKLRPSDDYPRYRRLRPRFERLYATFLGTLDDAQRQNAVPEWCEVSYINEIPAAATTGHGHMELGRVLRHVVAKRDFGPIPAPENTQLQERFLIRTAEGEPKARLHLTATPAFRTDDEGPVYVITLLVRGSPAVPTLEGVLEFFDFGRRLIVQGFTEMTTPEMHDEWGLTH